MMNLKLTGFGPAMIDYHIHTGESNFEEAQEIIGHKLEIGGWYELESLEQFKQLLKTLAPNQNYTKFAGCAPANAIASAVQHDLDCNFIVNVGSDEGEPDEDGLHFIKSLKAYNIEVQSIEIEGDTTKLLAVTIPGTKGEKTMFILPGVKSELKKVPEENIGEYFLTDAYELVRPPTSSALIEVFESKITNVALGLANFELIKSLKDLLLDQITKGNIKILSGNLDEYRELISDQNISPEEVLNHPKLKNLSDIVVTNGKDGVYARSGIETKHQEAVMISKSLIVSTIGAGDAVAGTYLAGLINNLDLSTRLLNAVIQAKKVIQLEDSRLPA